MKTLLGKTQERKVAEFAKLITQGLDAWTKAGELLVEMVDECEHTYKNIIQEMPEMSYEVLSRFEQIGRKQLYPKLLLSGSTGLRKLATLPYSEQKKYYEKPIEVLIETKGGVDTLNVLAKDMTPFQVKQVFNHGSIRDLGEQRSWLRSKNHKTVTAAPEGNAYTIKGGTLVVSRPCKLSMKDLANIMAQMS